ncbi:transglycosylase family protein [Streptantibioticus silvisoli]|uniref:Transglycosylase family protein n=1 Tax=Streptantibioticus silvisoli TaxID=2705255 RepID=A0ABT6W3E3_9ACTN|nr:transglycosylase family protein [Streptantibioticus silvisoli]MDI5965263.1 transglycosylase family protein [Streptantibioticus silvisoli]
MRTSGNGAHRRPRQAPRFVVTVGATGAGIALPLLTSAGAAHAATTSTWDRVAACETGGTWSAASDGFAGGLALTRSVWQANGGAAYAASPDLASRQEQIAVAQRILDAEGPGYWGECAITAGLARGGAAPDVDPGSGPATPDPGTGLLGGLLGGPPPTSAPAASGPASAAPAHTASGAAPSKRPVTGSATGSGRAATGSSATATDPGTSTTAPATAPATAPTDPSTTAPATAPGTSTAGSAGASGSAGVAGTSGVLGGVLGGGVSPSGASTVPGSPNSSATSGDSCSSGDSSVPGVADSGGTPSGRHAKPGAATDGEQGGAGGAGRGAHARPGMAEAGEVALSAYTVQPGDNLYEIATKHSLPGGWPALFDANHATVGHDPGLIRPGQHLTLG